MNFICKDILRLLINEKCSGKTALNCLLVCKKFNQCGDKKIVLKKCLKEIIYEENKDHIERINDNMCKKCNLILDDSKKMKQHLHKHAQQEKAGKKIQINRVPETCTYCNVPYIGSNSQHVRYCKMRIETCRTAREMFIYPFIESLCTKPEGYLAEMKNHTCNIRCRECKEEFEYVTNCDTNHNSVSEHLKTCVKRMDMVSKYRLKRLKIVEKNVW